MKKTVIVCFLLVLSLNVLAQSKITITGVIGKWVISSVEIVHLFTYDIEKDAVSFGDSLSVNMLRNHITKDSVMKMLKPSLEIYTKMFYQFNADGTGEIYYGQGPASDYRITYSIDEEASTITTTDRHQKNLPFKAEMIQNKLSFFINQTPQDGGMDIHFIFNKEK